MKTCPVCNTQVFDDMQSCYGCMHRFDTPPTSESVAYPPMHPAQPPLTERSPAASLYDEGRFGQRSDGVAQRTPVMERNEPLMASFEPAMPLGAVESPADLAEWNEVDDIAARAQHSPRARQAAVPLVATPDADEVDDRQWKVRLEVRVASSPAQVWSAEFSPSMFTPLPVTAVQDCTVS